MLAVVFKRRLALLVVVAASCLGVWTDGALASGPIVSWSMQPVVDSGAKAVLSYSLVVARGERSYLQREAGRRWVDVLALRAGKRMQLHLPVLSTGSHVLRVAIVSGSGRYLRHTSNRTLDVVPRPQVSWSLPDSESAGQTLAFAYTTIHAPTGSAVAFQQQKGTGHVWKTLATAPRRSGTSTLPAQQIGQNYKFRIVIVDRGVVLTEQTTTVDVFGQVPLADLLGDPGGAEYGGTYTAPSSVFNYELRSSPCYDNGMICGGVPTSYPMTEFSVQPASNDCNQIALSFIEGAVGLDGTGNTMTVSVLQQAANAVSATADFNVVGSLKTPLTPGQSWSLTVEGTVAQDDGVFYINGYGICDSTQAIIPTG